jgi:membrane-associated phospholipid phosphatase
LNTQPTPGWTHRLAARFWTLWYLKAAGTAAFMVLFFQAYFWVLHHPSQAPTVVPLLPIDHWVPFTPAAIYAYGWLWVYVSLPPALIVGFWALVRYGVWIALLCLVCLGIFWLWPTQTPVFDIDWSAHPQLAFLKGLDAASNACPSLHVAAALHAAFWLRHQLREIGAPGWLRALNVLQCLAIVWSTMAIRQHVFLDVFSGAAVGLLFAWLSLRRWRPLMGATAAGASRAAPL